MYKELKKAEINEILENYICKSKKIYESGKRAVEEKYDELEKIDPEIAKNYYLKYINIVDLETYNEIKIATIKDLLIRVLLILGKDISIINYLKFDCLLENFIRTIQDVFSDNRCGQYLIHYSAKQYCNEFISKILDF